MIEENTLAGIGAENSENLFSASGYFANIDTPDAKKFADDYSSRYGADAAALNSLGESCYEGVKFLQALAQNAGSLAIADFENAAEGTRYSSPRGTATMQNRHVSTNIYLAEAKGTDFQVVETFTNVDPGSTCN